MCRGYTDVVDADLSKYFDTIPHAGLVKSVARRIVDRHVLWLIKLWLRAPVEERSGDGTRRMSGGRSNKRGTPQGGVASPLLSVIYMNRFLKHWRLTGRGEAFRAYIISYADDFVILSRGHAAEALTWTKAVMTKLGLTLNEAKTSVKDARCEGFDFLGYTLGPRHLPNGGRWYLGASPSKKSVRRIKAKISALLTPGNKGAWPKVRMQLNRLLGGWSTYFCYGALASAYEAVDRHVYDRTRNFLRKRHKVQGRGTDLFSREYVYGELAVRCLARARQVAAVGLTMKPVGKPDAGNLHVRFDVIAERQGHDQADRDNDNVAAHQEVSEALQHGHSSQFRLCGPRRAPQPILLPSGSDATTAPGDLRGRKLRCDRADYLFWGIEAYRFSKR